MNLSSCSIYSYLTATFVMEAMAAANALRRWRRNPGEKAGEVRIKSGIMTVQGSIDNWHIYMMYGTNTLPVL